MNDKGKIIWLICILFSTVGFLLCYLILMITAEPKLKDQPTYNLVKELHVRSLSKKGRWEIYKATNKVKREVMEEIE